MENKSQKKAILKKVIAEKGPKVVGDKKYRIPEQPKKREGVTPSPTETYAKTLKNLKKSLKFKSMPNRPKFTTESPVVKRAGVVAMSEDGRPVKGNKTMDNMPVVFGDNRKIPVPDQDIVVKSKVRRVPAGVTRIKFNQ